MPISSHPQRIAFLGDAAVAQAQQPLLDLDGQRRRRDVKAQMNRARHLVDVLPARTLRPNGRDLDLGLLDGK